MVVDKNEIRLMVETIRAHYGWYHSSDIVDLLQLCYTEFNIELSVDDVREYCQLQPIEEKIIYRTWGLG